MRAAGEAYLTAVVRGEIGTAYDLLCEADRREQPRATWHPVGDRRTVPTGFRITGVVIDRPEGAGSFTLRTVTADLTYADHSGEVVLTVDKQDGV